ncbi:hypothetical protein ACWEQC_28425 [Streptomyces shenzhenensis]
MTETAPTGSKAQLHARVAARDVVLLGVRPAEECPAGHIPGAVAELT